VRDGERMHQSAPSVGFLLEEKTVMPTLREMKAQYDNLREEMQSVLVKGELEKRDLTPEESAKFDAMDADINALHKNIERRERMEELERNTTKTVGKDPTEVALRAAQANPEERKKAESKAWERWFRYGYNNLNGEERSALARQQAAVYSGSVINGEADFRDQSTTTTAGGYTIPQGFSGELQKYIALYGGVRPVARNFPTPSGNDIPWPTVDDTTNSGELLGENQPAGSQDVVFGQVTLKAFKFSSKLVKVSKELLQDSYFNVGDILRDLFVDRLGRITNSYFTTGTGSSEPQGIVTGATLGVTATSGQTGTIIYNDLVDLEHSVDPLYRPNAKWMFNDSTLKALKKLKDSSGRPLWMGYAESSFGPQVAQPTILGYQYQINQNMANIGTSGSPVAGNKSILFGDFNRYIVRDVLNMELIRLDERYAEYGQVAFLMFMRADGRTLNTAAIKYFINPTS
jgi:HK97 family phage major capsid protein